jgi:hypothetical protein
VTATAIFFILLIVAAVSIVVLTHYSMRVERWCIKREKQKDERKSGQKNRLERPSNIKQADGRVIASLLNALVNQIYAQQQQQQSQDIARACRETVTMLALVVAGVGTVLSAIFLSIQLIDARKSANIQHLDTQQALIATERPWIAFDDRKAQLTNLEISNAEISISFRFTLENLGRSPALAVNPKFVIFPLALYKKKEGTPVNFSGLERNACGGSTRREEYVGYTIFPEKTLDLPYTSSISQKDVSKIIKQDVNYNPIWELAIAGCIIYRFYPHGPPLHTYLAFMITKNSGDQIFSLNTPIKIPGTGLRATIIPVGQPDD